jgi:hypothetical protein
MATIEKRQTPRFEVDQPVAVRRGDGSVEGTLLNLSLGGARVHAPLRPASTVGERMVLTFDVPTDADPMTFEVESAVRWASPVDPATIGVQFLRGFRAKETYALGRYLDALAEIAGS